MKKTTILIINLLLSFIVHAQLIDNKLNIYLSYSVGSFWGSETINEDNYITPSLYSNYNNLSGFSLKGLVNAKDILSFGANFDYQSANNWNSSNYVDYENSEVQLYSITPLARIHNKFKEKGLFNRLKIYGELGPTIGISSLSLSQSLYNIRTDDNNDFSHPMKDGNIFLGLKGAVGFEYSFTQSFGCFLSYSYNLNWISSKFYNDKNLKSSIINVGLVVKLKKNKYFYY